MKKILQTPLLLVSLCFMCFDNTPSDRAVERIDIDLPKTEQTFRKFVLKT